MSERMEEARWELEEDIELRVSEDDQPVEFGLSLPQPKLGQAFALLDSLFPGGRRVPWVYVTCRGHRSGARLRLKRDADGWRGIVGRGSPLTLVTMTREPRAYDLGVKIVEEVDAPLRWQLECRECGQQTRLDPDRLGAMVLGALVEWDREGRSSTVSVSWTATPRPCC